MTERPPVDIPLLPGRRPVPGVIGDLLRRSTFQLWCEACPRFVIVDMLALLDRYGPHYETGRMTKEYEPVHIIIF